MTDSPFLRRAVLIVLTVCFPTLLEWPDGPYSTLRERSYNKNIWSKKFWALQMPQFTITSC